MGMLTADATSWIVYCERNNSIVQLEPNKKIITIIIAVDVRYYVLQHIERGKKAETIFFRPSLFAGCVQRQGSYREYGKSTNILTYSRDYAVVFHLICDGRSVWGTHSYENYAFVIRLKYHGSGSHIYNYSIMHIRSRVALTFDLN